MRRPPKLSSLISKTKPKTCFTNENISVLRFLGCHRSTSHTCSSCRRSMRMPCNAQHDEGGGVVLGTKPHGPHVKALETQVNEGRGRGGDRRSAVAGAGSRVGGAWVLLLTETRNLRKAAASHNAIASRSSPPFAQPKHTSVSTQLLQGRDKCGAAPCPAAAAR